MTPRCILITGAGGGIGAGIAAELASAGHHLVVTDVNPMPRKAWPPRSATPAVPPRALALDVTSDDSVVAALAAVSRPVEVLVNNAGLQHVAPLEEFPIAKWDFLVQVMLVGVARLTRAVLRACANAASAASSTSVRSIRWSPRRTKSAYVAAKHGLPVSPRWSRWKPPAPTSPSTPSARPT